MFVELVKEEKTTLMKRFFRTMATVDKSRIVQPKWHTPKRVEPAAVLKLYNTLTRTKEEFHPIEEKKIKWYCCGPTVYDSSHMGHARNYVSTDINRRILQDYFNYDVTFVQNVTDIDDKIIIRARHNYLYEKFEKDTQSITPEILKKVQQGWEEFVTKNLPEASLGDFEKWAKEVNVSEKQVISPKFPMHLKSAKNAYTALNSEVSREEFFTLVKDVVVPLLDKELGSSINEPEIFRSLPSFWEKKFDEDMAALNVLSPTITTRVSEYVPEIIDYVSKIISNGYAYSTSDGSVYFDTVSFDKTDAHDYAKLQPWNKGQADLIAEGEGSLTSNTTTKRSPNDFALWKASKPGEPEWESPWGKGRPGWHIECSVMASDVLGQQMDIHSGGIDLAFPHHDNELAQAEACFDNEQWVNYFLHTGHLHIEGQKMSKSLKNFITIQEALEKYTARQLRLAFASAQWNNQLDFKEDLLSKVKSFESTLNKFFQNVRALKNDQNNREGIISKKLRSEERALFVDLDDAKKAVHLAFCDNLSTPKVISILTDTVSKTNSYIVSSATELRIDPVLQVTYWITRILEILGFPSRSDKLGWDENNAEASKGSVEEVASPFVKALSNFRDQVRSSAISKAPYTDFLSLTDTIRNHELLSLGVSLDDRTDGQPALIKFLSRSEKEELIKLQEEKEKADALKKEKKLAQQKLKEQQEKERLEKSKIKPSELFKTQEYSEWDDTGLPTKDKDGNDVSKSARKKLQKLFDNQKKLHDEYLAKKD